MKKEHDLSKLLTFASDNGWYSELDDIIESQTIGCRREYGVSPNEIADLLGPHHTNVLFNCAVEELLSIRFSPDDANIVDEFLKRRGWNETPVNKFYMRALRDSVTSLYEVSDVVPGESMLVRDLIRGGEPIRVSEKGATQTLKQWDKISARVLPRGQGHILSGSVLQFKPGAADVLITSLKRSQGKSGKHQELRMTDAALKPLAGVFTNTWLLDALSNMLEPHQMTIQNSDGQELMFHTAHFKIAKNSSQADIAQLMNSNAEFEPSGDHIWTWSGQTSNTLASPLFENAVRASIELTPTRLMLTTNSAERAGDAIKAISTLLGDRVGKALTAIQTLEQASLTERPTRPTEQEVPIEAATEITHNFMDRHYKAVLDEAIPMLDNKTPRQAAKTERGREKLIEWLKFIENSSGNATSPNDPMRTYSFAWMWAELNVEHLRS